MLPLFTISSIWRAFKKTAVFYKSYAWITKSLHWFFFEIIQYNSDTHNTRIFTLLWTHVCKPYPYEHLRRLSRQILEIDEVITDASYILQLYVFNAMKQKDGIVPTPILFSWHLMNTTSRFLFEYIFSCCKINISSYLRWTTYKIISYYMFTV